VLSDVADFGIINDISELAGFGVVVIALLGRAYPTVLPRITPHL
jgi:hypothetical protein